VFDISFKLLIQSVLTDENGRIALWSDEAAKVTRRWRAGMAVLGCPASFTHHFSTDELCRIDAVVGD
jgi:hypothetical protein